MPKYSYIESMPHIAKTGSIVAFYEQLEKWKEVKQQLTDESTDKSILNLWLQERHRAYAIGTGEVEGLYRFKRGVTEQLITEGLAGVESSHTFDNVEESTLRGLLKDQLDTLEVVFELVKEEVALTQHLIRGLHEQVTQNQKTAPGVNFLGKKTQVPLNRGVYKTRPNNPTRPDGEIHEYCPPETTHAEMSRLLDWHQQYMDEDIGVLEHAAWLHHRFVQIHPFQDGNGRMARLLMSYVLIKGGAIPPIISLSNRANYIGSLELTDEGSLDPFVDFLALQTANSLSEGVTLASNLLQGRAYYQHPNRGVTIDGTYHPPDSVEAVSLHCPVEQTPSDDSSELEQK